jgi:hypothetical protein
MVGEGLVDRGLIGPGCPIGHGFVPRTDPIPSGGTRTFLGGCTRPLSHGVSDAAVHGVDCMAKGNAVPAEVRDDGPARRGAGDHLTRRDAEAPTSGPVDGSVSLQPDVRRLVGLQRTAGNRAVSGLLTAGTGRGERPRCLSAEMRGGSSGVSTLQRLGTPLDKPIPAGEPTPAFGEVAGEQRKFTPAQYIAMWEKEQGRTLNSNEKSTIERGCIGITANNLNGGGDPPLDPVFGPSSRPTNTGNNPAMSTLITASGTRRASLSGTPTTWTTATPAIR